MSEQQDPVIELRLATSVVNYILAIASERPFKESAPLIQMIQQQAQEYAQKQANAMYPAADPGPAKKQ